MFPFFNQSPIFLLYRHTDIQNGPAHGSDQNHLKRTNVISMTKQLQLAKQSLDSKPVKTKEPHKPDKIWELDAKSSSASKHARLRMKLQQNLFLLSQYSFLHIWRIRLFSLLLIFFSTFSLSSVSQFWSKAHASQQQLNKILHVFLKRILQLERNKKILCLRKKNCFLNKFF